MPDPAAYLVFDIETVSDGRLVQRVRYPEEPGLSPAAAVAKYRDELRAQSGGKSDFVPHTYQVPVSVAVAKVAKDYSLLGVATLDRPRFRPHVITRAFWKGWLLHQRPTLVTFNGRGFDVPVLEHCAFRYGIPMAEWFAPPGLKSYDLPRNRFNTQAHLDLQDFLGNQGASTVAGGLNLLAQLLGKPGKLDVRGDQVQGLWERGERERIDNYCMHDTLDTYFVFLRTRVLCGFITLERERQLVEGARAFIEKASATSEAMAEYLRSFRYWAAPGDEDDGFLA